MGRHTKIEWCDGAVNPVMGCQGCELLGPPVRCYAAKMHRRFAGKNPGYPNEFLVPTPMPLRMYQAAAWSDLRGTRRRDKPWLDGFPRVIFVGDMGDVFSEGIPPNFIYRSILMRSDQSSRHEWVILTKQIAGVGRLADWCRGRRDCSWSLRWPDNLTLVASVTSQETAHRIAGLHRYATRPIGVSLEPLLGPVDLSPALERGVLSWVIIGCERNGARPGRPCKEEWVERIVIQCSKAGVPVFVKQLERDGRVVSMPEVFGRQWAEMPEQIRVRGLESEKSEE